MFTALVIFAPTIIMLSIIIPMMIKKIQEDEKEWEKIKNGG